MNHPVGTTDAIATLTRFSRTLSTATDPAEMLHLLARASIEQMGASGAVVLQVGEEGIARVAAHAGISIPDDFSTNVDEIGPELGRRLIEAAGEHFEQAHTFPLVSDGDLFGALVVLFKEGTLAEVNLHLAAGLVDLAASMLGKAYRYTRLNRAHAELKAAQEILERTEKLRALGEMAAGISHDLGNILGPMTLQVDLLDRAPQDIERVKKIAQTLRRVLKRGVDTVERLRAFSRQSPEENAAELADVNALVSEAIDLVRHRTGFQGSNVQIDLGHPPQVMLASSELVSALVNIIVNAFEALPPEGGSVAFRTGASPYGAWVQVQDTGSGIPDEMRRRLFEPFFTTKGKMGTGLGLSMVYAFVQRYAGHIDVQSAPGQGTTITLTFPSAPAQHEHPGAPAPTGAR